MTTTMTMHSASVPVFVRMLENMRLWLDKAEQHAAARRFDASVYMSARLAPDMLAFPTQVQIACDAAKFCVARLSGTEAPKFDDTETTLAALRERIGRTIDYLQTVPAARIDGSDAKTIEVPRRTGSTTMSGQSYLSTFAMPTFFFHVTTVYALLRANGVDLGKADYLGPLPSSPAA